MMASPSHWRRLVGVIVGLMAAMMILPAWLPTPAMDENRVLARRPALPDSWAAAATFRKGADAWIADSFPARTWLIGGLNRLRMLAGVSGSSRVVVGRQGWLFYDDGSHMRTARGDPPATRAEMEAWLKGLAGRTEWLRARGAAYLVLVPPLKEVVYPQFGPAWYAGPSPDRTAPLAEALARTSGAGDVLYVGDDVAAATRRGVRTFSRHDTHWTGRGAYEGYAALMRRLHAMGLAEGPRPASDFTSRTPAGYSQARDLALMLGVASFVRIDSPRLADLASEAAATVTYLGDRRDWTGPRVIDTGQTGKPVLLITVDSFSNALMSMLYGHFSRIVVAHNQDGPWRPDLIERFHPDVVVLEVLESGLPFMMVGSPAPPPAAAARIEADVARTLARRALRDAPAMTPLDLRLRHELAAATQAPGCNVEGASLTGFGTAGGALTLEGWISELAPANTSATGLVRLTGGTVDMAAALEIDRSRPDVAEATKVPAAAASGFAGVFRAPPVPGRYEARIYRRSGPGWVVCRQRPTLILAP